MAHVTNVNIYPLKGARPATVAGEVPQELTALEAGFHTSGFHDRELFVAAESGDGGPLAVVTPRGWDDGDGPPVKHRTDTHLAALAIDLPKAGLMEVTGPDGRQLTIDRGSDEFQRRDGAVPVQLHGGTIFGIELSDQATAFVTEQLGRPACLMRIVPGLTRVLRDGRNSSALAADGFPYLLTNRASLRALNELEGMNIPDERYRTNIELDFEGEPFLEDDVDVFKIGDQWYAALDASGRCDVTNIGRSGKREGGGLRVLRSRNGVKLDKAGRPIPDSEAAFYGVNAGRLAVLSGHKFPKVRVGDDASVLRKRAHPHVRLRSENTD